MHTSIYSCSWLKDLTWCSGPSEMLHYFLMPTLNCEPLELENCFINLPSVLKQGWHVSPIHLTTFAGKRRKNCTCREDSNFWPLFTRQKCGAMTWTMIGPVEASLSRAYFWGRWNSRGRRSTPLHESLTWLPTKRRCSPNRKSFNISSITSMCCREITTDNYVKKLRRSHLFHWLGTVWISFHLLWKQCCSWK